MPRQETNNVAREYRFDIGELSTVPGEGFKRCRVKIARPGVFPYMHTDGRVRLEAKLPQDLFSRATVDSAKGAPITEDHPPMENGAKGLLTGQNYQLYTKGALGDNVEVEDGFLVATETIYDEALREKMQRGEKVQVSIGFTSDIENSPGEYEGQRYDSVQRNIRINHIAHVDVGRAGEEVRAYLDSAEGQRFAIQTTRQDGHKMPQPNNKNQVRRDTGRISRILDRFRRVIRADEGENIEQKEELIEDLEIEIQALQEEISESKDKGNDNAEEEPKKKESDSEPEAKTLEQLKAENISLKEKVQKLNDSLEEQKKETDALRDEMNDETTQDSKLALRSSLIEVALKAEPELRTDGMSNRELKLAVIAGTLPFEAGIRRDSISAERLDAQYQAAVQLLRERAANEGAGDSARIRIDEEEINKKRLARQNLHKEGK
ncbi:MAG: DUF2213 domain-containing protein [Leptospiraceae bacterium]|nr:DUF2213 domain-containing protein [Leptospiraceae bacterium]